MSDSMKDKSSQKDIASSGKNRRRLLAGLALGAGGMGAASILSAATEPQSEDNSSCLPDDAGPQAARFPQHLVVQDHRGRKLRFYNDLIKNKIVMVHFMSTTLEGDYQTARNLAQMQRILGNRLGHDFHLLSVTVDPVTDSVDVLAEYAEHHQAGSGWSFITGTDETLQSIKDALFFRPGGHGAHHQHDEQDCSMGLIRYGNDATGLWGSVPTRTDPVWLAERLTWMMPKNGFSASPSRGGPPVRST